MNLKYKCVRQMDETDCGAASIAAVCEYYGKKADLSQVRRLARVDRYGSNMLALRDAAQKLGFDAEGLEGDFSGLKEVELPCIAHVVKSGRLEHYIVLYSADDERVVAADPACGIVTMTAAEFCGIWSGHILSLVPNGNFRRSGKGHRRG